MPVTPCAAGLRRAARLLCTALAVLLAGCFPNVTWLPDGSGFVFTENGGRRLVHYDLRTSERRTLCEDTKTKTLWPAVSPDGKRIAVAHWLRQKDQPDRLQIILYRLGGVEEWRSTSFAMEPSQAGPPDDGETCLIWGGSDRILVGARNTAWYDLQKDELIPIEGCSPYLSGVSPMRPDGKGFLAVLREGEGAGEAFAFVDLAGKAHPIPGKLTLGDDLVFHGLRWEKNVAVLSGPRAKIEIDTDNRTLRQLPAEMPALLPAAGKLGALHLFPGARAALCVYECSAVRGGQQVAYHRIEWQDPGAKRRRVLVPECETLPVVFPSPDRTRVALRYTTAKDQHKVLVVESSGKVVATVDGKE